MLYFDIEIEDCFENRFDVSQLKLYDGKESIYELPKHDDKFPKYFENKTTNHIFCDPIVVYMEEFFTTKFQLCFFYEDQAYNKFPTPLQVLVLILLKKS